MKKTPPETCIECGEGQLEFSRMGETTWGGRSVPVILLVGVQFYRCNACGVEQPEILNPLALQQALMDFYVQKPERLNPKERRHVRKLIGWSIEDTARHLDTDSDRVRSWEEKHEAMTLMEEVSLRLAASRSEINLNSFIDSNSLQPSPTVGFRERLRDWAFASGLIFTGLVILVVLGNILVVLGKISSGSL